MFCENVILKKTCKNILEIVVINCRAGKKRTELIYLRGIRRHQGFSQVHLLIPCAINPSLIILNAPKVHKLFSERQVVIVIEKS